MNKLPDLFTNTFDKKIDNSQEYTKISNNINSNIKINKEDLNNKIDSIFKSKNFIYKTKVNISLENENIICTIIGKTKNNLITIDNKLINIDKIIDIKKVN